MSSILAFLRDVDWKALLSGAFVGALGLGIRTVIQAPIKAMTEQARAIRLLSFLSPQRPFRGRWQVTWRVESSRFPSANVDVVTIYRLFSNVTFSTTATLRDGSRETCVFVGKLVERTLTGRWHNPADEDRGYFGSFQVRLHASLRSAAGSWIGWSNDGKVQANDLTLERKG